MMDLLRDDLKYKEIPSKPTYPENFCPELFLAKVWLKNTLPTYSLDIRYH